MNTRQIDSVLRSDRVAANTFQGVYARDEFIKLTIVCPSLYVCNLDESTKSGSHWIAIYFSPNGRCEYFDSYGIPPIYNDLKQKLLESCKGNVIYNNSVLQGINTTVCGHYCIVFCLMKSRRIPFSRLLNVFFNLSSSTEIRDHLVYNKVTSSFQDILSLNGYIPSVHIQEAVPYCLYLNK